MVIGESESRDLMHCYVGDKVRENTPWFDKQKNNPNFIFFENAYACWIQTVPVLERALTEKINIIIWNLVNHFLSLI